MKLLSAVRRANRPGPPENSIALRVACAGAVVTGIAACHAEGELSPLVTVASVLLVIGGMVLSYRTRSRPLPAVKPVLALAAVGAFVWFFHQLTGQAIYDVSTVEDPLAVLFVWVQVAHAFDVPARRDLGCSSLAGSASLGSVAAAQALHISFGVYVLPWLAFGPRWACSPAWSSASQGGRVQPASALLATLAAVAVVGVAVLVVLPAPHVAGRVDFPSVAGPGQQLPVPGALAGDGSVAQLAKPGSPAGRTRVGGYLGFANRLDTALRGDLGNTVVMRVRAQRPSYWVGETFNDWDGSAWSATDTHSHRLDSGSPFLLWPRRAAIPGSPNRAQTDLQTFYIVQPSPNLVFHADTAHEVWFPSGELFTSDAGTIVSPIGLGPGAVYTVDSDVATPSADQLRASGGVSAAEARSQAQYLELPHTYPRVQALARSLTARTPDTFDKVQRLIAWIGAHTHYSTDIPPLAPGQDTVDEFLFGNRTGFCEQISTSLAVMLRSVGIPGTRNRRVRARPVQPHHRPLRHRGQGRPRLGAGVVPRLRMGELRSDRRRAPRQSVAGLHASARERRRAATPAVDPHRLRPRRGRCRVCGGAPRRSRPATWAQLAARRIEQAGRRAGRPRLSEETLSSYAGALDVLARDPSGSWRALAVVVEAAAYGGHDPGPDDAAHLLTAVDALRRQLPAWGGAAMVLVVPSSRRRPQAPRRRTSPPPTTPTPWPWG